MGRSPFADLPQLPGNDVVAKWRHVFDHLKAHTASEPFAMELVDVGPDHVVIEMPITDVARQPYGLLHGGASILLAETAASMHACWGLDLKHFLPVGLEVSASHLHSASEGRVQARGRVLKRGATTVVHEVEIVHVQSGRILSTVRVTNLIRPAGTLEG
jgi:1,4-dihydroxy-2-naphthoyl-CoA hydrolase